MEVVDLSRSKYPNRDALREAHDIYLDTMSQFVSKCLNEDIEEDIEISRIAYYVRTYWDNLFESEFDRYYEARSATQLIVEGRNRASHPPWDLDLEFTRTQLFLIAELLGKIGRLNAQREVEVIRDKLFSDDTAERLAESEQRLVAVESEKNEYEKDNAALSKQVDEKEKQRKKLDRNLKNAKERNNKLKSDVAGVEKRLEESEAAQADYKNRLEAAWEELKETKAKWKEGKERFAAVSNQLAQVQAENEDIRTQLTTMPDLFMMATLASEIRPIFPTFDTHSPVRIFDRRGIDKKDYLRKLLNQKQPSIIYVQSEEKVEELLTSVLPEKADVIEKLYEATPEAEEKKILEKLARGELIAVVSNAVFSTLASAHCVEHFVFCHLSPDLDMFFERCQPAFTSTRNVYLHLIYESKRNIERSPNDETIRSLYRELHKLRETNGDFINYENVYEALNMEKLEVETGLVILEELQYLERKKMGIKLLQPSGKQLEESATYCNGKKFREEVENSPAFQYEQSIEQIWESILEKVNVDNAFVLRENNISTELEEITVEPLTESVEGIYETAASEFVTVLEPQGAVSKVREPRLSIANRYVAETTEADRDKLAVQIAALRINATGSRPLAWKDIRAEFGLKYDQFHKVIRLSLGYRKAVIDRIKSLKAQEGGWEYSGKLDNLTGIDDISEDELK